MSMFCYQCEQTSQGTGCTTMGICGKDPVTAALQDMMVHIVKGISQYAYRARQMGASDPEIDRKTLEALFMTLTNVNFDADEHVSYIAELAELLKRARLFYEDTCHKKGEAIELLTGPAQFQASADRLELMKQAYDLNIKDRAGSEDIVGLQELVTYGVKGLAAYAHHAQLIGYTDPRIVSFVHEAFDYISKPVNEQSVDGLLKFALRAGEINLITMELLDKAHTETYGHPEPTSVRITPRAGKCILVSGHDIRSLYELLKQTEGKGINVYTHGELLPALAYPELKKFSHLVGNYGGAWQNQIAEFADFPGAILMTTNCLKPPAETYKDRLFTMDVVGFSGISKLYSYDYSALIEAALKAPGFEKDGEDKTIMIGFARNAVLGVADKVIEAVKAGNIRHFFLIGGCDGAEFSRNYYTDLAEQIPADCAILTLGCGKYRFNMEEFGNIGGIPRLLDLGQCNDAYSAVKIASALADAFGCGINDLPLSMVLSWFEQKAVAVLLSLLFLGVKNIRIGPNLPAFITPAVLNVLVESFALTPVGTPEKDLNTMLKLVSV